MKEQILCLEERRRGQKASIAIRCGSVWLPHPRERGVSCTYALALSTCKAALATASRHDGERLVGRVWVVSLESGVEISMRRGPAEWPLATRRDPPGYKNVLKSFLASTSHKEAMQTCDKERTFSNRMPATHTISVILCACIANKTTKTAFEQTVRCIDALSSIHLMLHEAYSSDGQHSGNTATDSSSAGQHSRNKAVDSSPIFQCPKTMSLEQGVWPVDIPAWDEFSLGGKAPGKGRGIFMIANQDLISPSWKSKTKTIVPSLLYQLFDKGRERDTTPNDWNKTVIVCLYEENSHRNRIDFDYGFRCVDASCSQVRSRPCSHPDHIDSMFANSSINYRKFPEDVYLNKAYLALSRAYGHVHPESSSCCLSQSLFLPEIARIPLRASPGQSHWIWEGDKFPYQGIGSSRLDCGDEVRHPSRLVPWRSETRTGEARFSTLNVCGDMDDKIDDVCELMKDRRLDILCGNDTKRKEILRGSGDIVASLLYQLFSKCKKSHRVIRGVRQGCKASPWLFNLFMDSCLYDLKEYECRLRMDALCVKFLLHVRREPSNSCVVGVRAADDK
ncbi:hypothetical protein EVAR_6354_1 [Eumeta japonica]|uniref:Reverse transcriptase domain-containing protein n=1 Tax=Eumeta variegata TaxID=151549 RepID=A0A4C1TF15_EUMVA|nr:hypothetical protein EVAR_6354_1 [Eumeta japonica]